MDAGSGRVVAYAAAAQHIHLREKEYASHFSSIKQYIRLKCRIVDGHVDAAESSRVVVDAAAAQHINL